MTRTNTSNRYNASARATDDRKRQARRRVKLARKANRGQRRTGGTR